MVTPGQYIGMPASEYHSIEALSASGAKHLLRSPAHYLAARAAPHEPSAAMKLGTVVHTLVLEPEKAVHEIAVAPKFDRRTSLGRAAADEFEAAAGGKLIIDEGSYDIARRIADRVRAHPLIKTDLDQDGVSELTMLWNQHGVPCKARVDRLSGFTMLDVKTCKDASPSGFAKQIGKFKYHMQHAHYANGFREIHGWDLDRFVFIAVETDPPFEVGLYSISPRSLQSGRALIERAAVAYKRAMDTKDMWKGYEAAIIEVDVPNWAQAEPAFEM